MMVHQPFLSEAEKLFKKLLYIEPLFSLGTAHISEKMEFVRI